MRSYPFRPDWQERATVRAQNRGIAAEHPGVHAKENPNCRCGQCVPCCARQIVAELAAAATIIGEDKP